MGEVPFGTLLREVRLGGTGVPSARSRYIDFRRVTKLEKTSLSNDEVKVHSGTSCPALR